LTPALAGQPLYVKGESIMSARDPSQFIARRLRSTWLFLAALVCVFTAAVEAAPLAYVVNTRSDTTSIIDTATGTVVAAPVTGRGPTGIVLHGARAYIANQSDQNVAVLDTETRTVIGTIPVGGGAHGIAIHPDGTRLYVTDLWNRRVQVIELVKNAGPYDGSVPFPAGAGMPPGFVTSVAPNAWTVDSALGNLSTASLRSAQVHSQNQSAYANSDLEYTGTFAAGNVTFAYKMSSYPMYGQFDFQIDGVTVFNSIGGEVGWLTTSQPIAAGAHTLRWRFKNRLNFPCALAIPPPPGGANCADRAWVDNIVMPLVPPFASTVVAAATTGDMPMGIAMHPSGSHVYAVNYGSDSVTVIDTATNAVAATIAVGSYPMQVAVSRDGTRAYVTNFVGNSLSVIDTASNTVIDTVAVGRAPASVTVDADGAWLYVVNRNDGTVSVIDALSHATHALISVGSWPVSVKLSSNGKRAYVANVNDDNVSIIDTTTNMVIGTVAVGDVPAEIALEPGAAAVPGAPSISATAHDGGATISLVRPVSSGGSPIYGYEVNCNPYIMQDFFYSAPFTLGALENGVPHVCSAVAFNAVGISARSNFVSFTPGAPVPPVEPPPLPLALAYVANNTDNTVSVIRRATNAVEATIPVGYGPFGIALAGNGVGGTRAYVANQYSGDITVIDTASRAVIGSIQAGAWMQGIVAHPSRPRVYAVDGYGGIAVIDTTTQSVVKTLPAGIFPYSIALDGAGARAYVVDSDGATVYVMDTATETIIATFPTLSWPRGIAVNAAGTLAYVADATSGRVSVIDTASGATLANVWVDDMPQGVALNASGTRLYVANQGEGTLSVINTATRSNIATIAIGGAPQGVSVSADGTRVYVTNMGGNTVSVVDAASYGVIATVTTGGGPAAVVVDF
jgi:YVTN family beta-propeller protein